MEGCLLLYHAKLSRCVTILDVTIRNTRHDTSCFAVMSVLCKNGAARLSESPHELDGDCSTVWAVPEGHSCSSGDGALLFIGTF